MRSWRASQFVRPKLTQQTLAGSSSRRARRGDGMRWQIALVFLVCVASPAFSQENKTAVAGPEYAASGTLRRWFGEGYRDVWTTPFQAPVLDLSREGGGLQPVRQVGGLQTAGLALRGADGKSYTFRS